MASNLTKLRDLLAQLFMFEFAELDFGIYRIMNSKRAEIQRFLDNDLLPQVRTELGKVESGERAGIQKEIDQAVANATSAGFNPDDSPKVKELRERLAAAGDPATLEDEVFSLLAVFFRRYYKDGDYLALRRYKKDVYALPYEGEEVKLHWANADQYYIKSSEYFRDYVFKLPDGRRVHFKLTEADTEQNNNKAAAGKERHFVLLEQEPLVEEDGEMLIRFVYRIDPEKQATLNRAAAAQILELVGLDFASWLEGLQTKAPTEKDPGRTLLEKHLGDYSARNSFDYFIHKDLRGFLRRELDFFIKSEVMLLDDIEEDTAPRVEQYLAKVRAVRRIAHKIIDMLAQLEEFQKKLWLKKKFVVATHYCVTLDRVPEELYAEIAANEAQREEWVRLFAIDEIMGDLLKPAYSIPLTVDFLKNNPFLVLDTKFFPPPFKVRLLASFDDLDAQLDGLLVHSENFQALNLLQERYRGQVEGVYIDPPYNTDKDGFIYKDNYKSSTWLSSQAQLLEFCLNCMSEQGAMFISCDENQAHEFAPLLRQTLGSVNHVETIIWNKRVPKNDKGVGNIHEYIYLFAKSWSARKQNNMSFVMRKDSIDEIYEKIDKLRIGRMPLLEAQEELKKYYQKEKFDRGITLYCELDPNYEIWGKINMSWPNPQTVGPRYEVINPVTNEPVPIPKNGWRWSEETFRAAERAGPVYHLPDGSLMKGKIWYAPNVGTQPSSVTYLRGVENFLLRSILSLKSDGSLELEDLGLGQTIDYPKPSELIERLMFSVSSREGFYFDYFAGSGTTAHAVISLNREDGGKRKYVLVEMGDYFDTVLKPRVLKVVYSKDWKDGRPVSRTGSSHMLKYIRLESYEDALNNLDLRRDELQTSLLESEAVLREDYMLRYMLDVESRGSASLLNIAAFAHPFDYTLKVSTGSVGETRDTAVDLVETFSYLLGLRVQQIDTIRGVVTVQGRNPEGQRVLIIWRDVDRLSNDELETFFQKQGYTTRDQEFDLIYVNGDNNLENLRRDDETWKVRLTEQEFQRLMFDVRDV